jgi:hypothetical protein
MDMVSEGFRFMATAENNGGTLSAASSSAAMTRADVAPRFQLMMSFHGAGTSSVRENFEIIKQDQSGGTTIAGRTECQHGLSIRTEPMLLNIQLL